MTIFSRFGLNRYRRSAHEERPLQGTNIYGGAKGGEELRCGMEDEM